MDVAALDVDLCTSGIEVLILQLTDFAAVHSVGVFGTEFLHVEFHHTAPNLLIWCKTNLDFAVLEVGMLHHILGSIHDFSHASFVIGAEQGRAIGGNHRLALILLHLRKF